MKAGKKIALLEDSLEYVLSTIRVVFKDDQPTQDKFDAAPVPSPEVQKFLMEFSTSKGIKA